MGFFKEAGFPLGYRHTSLPRSSRAREHTAPLDLRMNASEATPLSDQALVQKILQGQTSAFDLLVTRYRDQVYRFVLKNLRDPIRAEDLTQDTFIAAFQNLEGFQGNSKFSTWLLGIALNKIRNYINRDKEKMAHQVSDEVLGQMPSGEKTPLEAIEEKSSLQALEKGIASLPQDLREVLLLVSLEGLAYEEAAQALQLPLGTVKSKLFRARELLREKMQPFLSRG